jgi:signal transduction histidine kinase
MSTTVRTTASPRAKLLLFAALALYVVSSTAIVAQTIDFTIAEIIGGCSFLAVGALLVFRRPGNVLGPMFVVIGTGWNLVFLGIVTADNFEEAGRVDAASWVSLLATLLVIPMLWLNAAVWLLFPDGHTHSVAARRLLWGTGALTLVLMAGAAVGTPKVLPETKQYPNPFVGDPLASTMFDVFGPPQVLLVVLPYVAAGMLLARMRHADPITRRQIGWVAFAVLVNITLTLLNVAVEPFGTENRAFVILDSTSTLILMGAMAIAIMKFRLYEIDRIISRSVTFGVLAVFIGVVYVGIVVGVHALIPGAGFWLSIVASVIVAIAFQPARRRVERWANRLVYGERATPYEVLVRFSRRSAELPDDELLSRVPQLIFDGTSASAAALWVRTDTGFRMAASWPDEVREGRLGRDEVFVDPDADYSVPVFHDGELLGGLSLVKPSGESVTPPEQELLADLAAGLGLALRNARLTSLLRRQIAELESSRERVLAASDAARRRLENDLDSGPQQTLVAVKVKLGPIRKRAEQLGATKAAALLAQLEDAAGAAIGSVREFAGGIYPPLLEAEGLAVAIGQQARSSTIPVRVHGAGVGRYPRDIEAAIYFSVLEALQNTAKYAEANSVTITLEQRAGAIAFEVRDDGRGFDATTVSRSAGLTGMADRLDTVGGVVTVESSLGRGTRITGTVPIEQLVAAV